jgi:uncharacterized protein YndB with AHSA1/START domain
MSHHTTEGAMFHRSETVLIDAAPEVVYDYVADISRHPEWAHEHLEITPGPEARAEKGFSFEYVTHFMGSAKGGGIVTEAERPRVFTYECTDKDGRYRWTFELQAEESGTRLTHKMWRLQAPLYFKLLQPLLWPVIGRKMVSGGLANIKANLEASNAATA